MVRSLFSQEVEMHKWLRFNLQNAQTAVFWTTQRRSILRTSISQASGETSGEMHMSFWSEQPSFGKNVETSTSPALANDGRSNLPVKSIRTMHGTQDSHGMLAESFNLAKGLSESAISRPSQCSSAVSLQPHEWFQLWCASLKRFYSQINEHSKLGKSNCYHDASKTALPLTSIVYLTQRYSLEGNAIIRCIEAIVNQAQVKILADQIK